MISELRYKRGETVRIGKYPFVLFGFVFGFLAWCDTTARAVVAASQFASDSSSGSSGNSSSSSSCTEVASLVALAVLQLPQLAATGHRYRSDRRSSK